MAEEDLTYRMRAKGTRETAREIDRVGRSVRNADRDVKRSTKNLGIFSRALTLVQTKFMMFAIVGAALAPAVVPGILAILAAVVALGAVLTPVFVLGAGAMLHFKDTVGVAGSAAHDLATVLADLRHGFAGMVAPGAEILLQGLADSLKLLAPLMADMKGPLTVFAVALSQAVQYLAAGVAEMGPELDALVAASGPSIQLLAEMMLGLVQALVSTGTYGMPVLEAMLRTLRNFFMWLPGAVKWLDKFARSRMFRGWVETAFEKIAVAAKWVADVVSDLAEIAWKLLPMWRVVLGAVLWSLDTLRKAIGYINGHFETFRPLIYTVVAGFVAYKAAVIAAATATAIANGASKAWAATMAVIKAAGWAKFMWEYVRAFGAAQATTAAAGGIFGDALVGKWTKRAGRVGRIAGRAFGLAFVAGMIYEFRDPIEKAFKDFGNEIVDRSTGAFRTAKGFFTGSGGPSGGMTLKEYIDAGGTLAGYQKHQPLEGHKAGGGPIVRPGMYEVGERGREEVYLPEGAYVRPNHELGGDTVIPITLTLDGSVLTRVVHRHARKAKAVA